MHIYDKVSKKKQWKSSPIYPVLVSVLQKVREGTCLIAQLIDVGKVLAEITMKFLINYYDILRSTNSISLSKC
jgi:hypothetical protein